MVSVVPLLVLDNGCGSVNSGALRVAALWPVQADVLVSGTDSGQGAGGENITMRIGWTRTELAFANLAVLAIKRGASYYGQSKLLAAATGRTLEASRMKIRSLQGYNAERARALKSIP